jgi:hypothetical protein
MPRIHRKTRWPWLTLLILSMMLGMSWLVRAQPSGWGRGGPGGGGDDPGWSGGPGRGGPGGEGPGGPAHPRFDPRQAITIKGEIESLGSYGKTGWRVAPGMVVQGLVLKTANGYTEIDLGPPGYVAEKGLQLKAGDTLEVVGFQADRDGKNIFMAATVKTPAQTLRLLDERGFPLWRKRGPRGPGPGGMGADGPPERGMGPDGMGPGGQGRGRF